MEGKAEMEGEGERETEIQRKATGDGANACVYHAHMGVINTGIVFPPSRACSLSLLFSLALSL